MPLAFGQTPTGSDDEKERRKRSAQNLLKGPGGVSTPAGLPNAQGVQTDIFPDLDRVAMPQAAPVRDTSGLQFRLPEFQELNRGLSRQEADIRASRAGRLANIGQQYERATERATADQERAREALKERMASRGLFRSSPTTEKAGELQEDFSRYMDDLAYQRAAGEAGVEAEIARILNDISASREGLFAEQGRREEEIRLEQERIAAERAAREEQARQYQAMLQQQQAQAAAQAEAQRRALEMLANRPAPTINFGGGGGGFGGGGYSAGGGGGYAPAAPPPSDFDRWGQGFEWTEPWDRDSAIRMAQRRGPGTWGGYGAVYDQLNRYQGFFNKLASTYWNLNNYQWAPDAPSLINWWLGLSNMKTNPQIQKQAHGGHGGDIWGAM